MRNVTSKYNPAIFMKILRVHFLHLHRGVTKKYKRLIIPLSLTLCIIGIYILFSVSVTYAHFRDDRSGEGEASITPAEVIVGKFYRFVINFRVGEYGLPVGAKIRFCIPYGFSKPQDVDPMIPGFTTVESSRQEVGLTVNMQDTGYKWWRHIEVEIRKTALTLGDTIRLVYGEALPRPPLGANPGSRVQLFNKNIEFTVEVDPLGGGSYTRITNSPVLKIKSDRVTNLKCLVPSEVRVREPFDLRVIAQDVYGNVVDSCQETITITADENNSSIPIIYTFTPKDEGTHIFSGLYVQRPGIKRFIVKDELHGIKVLSNAMKVTSEEPQWRIYWGDIHGHTQLSDGLGTVDEYYTYARDKAQLDFAAITDHDNDRMFKLIPKKEWKSIDSVRWKLIQNAACEYNEPGKFVTFLGWEYSERKYGGDICVYYLRDDQPLFNCIYPEYDNPLKLWAALQDREAITVPHMHSRITWNYHDPHFQRLVEIYSVWGNSECSVAEGNTVKPRLALEQDKIGQWKGRNVQDALARGYRMGIMVAGDIHDGHPGNSNWLLPHFIRPHKYYWGGKTAVFAKELTREGIFDALYHRRCYGTTGARILVEFSIDGHIMGEEFKTASIPTISVKVAGTRPIKSVYLIRNNNVIYTYTHLKQEVDFSYTDTNIEKCDNYYYIRIVQIDDEMAWSSPIWVKYLTK